MRAWTLIALLVAGLALAQGYRNVSVQELRAANEPGHLVLDVRQPDEFAAGHVAGARLIPLDQLAARLAELPKNVPIYVFCRSGSRSRQASELLAAAGFRDVRNVLGGILAWQAARFPVQR